MTPKRLEDLDEATFLLEFGNRIPESQQTVADKLLRWAERLD